MFEKKLEEVKYRSKNSNDEFAQFYSVKIRIFNNFAV